MKIPADDLLRVLRCAPQGLTSAEVAERLSIDREHASARLSRLADHGRIVREYERVTTAPWNICRWHFEEAAHA